MFWQNMAPADRRGAPSAALAAKVAADFGSMDKMKKQFNAAAAGPIGSGWAWLVVTPQKKLAVTSTSNQDNPLMDLAEVKGMPIVALAVWEHAYYLKYQNKRGDYTAAWWNVVN
jgi:Fe-Mn family superoxide dismutase